MIPALPSSRVRPVVVGAVALVLLGAGFLALRRDHDRIGQALAADTPGRVLDRVAAVAAGDRREVRENLVRTATQIAGYALEWHLKPAAFGGGDGRWDGLTFTQIGYTADADGRFRTTDGAFALQTGSGGVSVVAEHERLGVQAVIEVRGARGGLEFVVDGRAVEGLPMPAARSPFARGSGLARERLQREADALAGFVTMVLGSGDPAVGERPGLAELGVEVGPDGAFHTPDGTLRLRWWSRRHGQITWTDPGGQTVSADVQAPDRPRLRPGRGGLPLDPGTVGDGPGG